MSKEEFVIKAQKRTVMGKKVNALRREGWLPGVVYGRHLQAFPIQMPAHETSLIMSKLTSSSLVTIDVDGEKHTAIVRDRQRDVIYGRLTHVDFLALSLNEKLRTTVGLELVGEAPVLKLADVILNQGVFELELECLPQDLPSKIEVDVSKIASMDDLITVGSLNLGDKITVLTDPSEVIISVGYSEQEKEPAAEAVEAPEVVERGKKEEEE
ncbi:MAG: 50S ribosomal protein L25 [Anaerolineaceae bacterium]|nr:50S ribosomal protein L25 [Anaerolineaceae bacterium]